VVVTVDPAPTVVTAVVVTVDVVAPPATVETLLTAGPELVAEVAAAFSGAEAAPAWS
jgi:hypothetical protein